MKIIFYSARSYEIQKFNELNKENLFKFKFIEDNLSEANIDAIKGFDAVCVFVNDNVSKQIIDAIVGNGIKTLLLRCAGFNNVDIDYAKAKNLQVARVPHYSPYAVAEHVIALLLTLNRKTHKAYNRVREGNFSLKGLVGFDLYRKSFGILGLGNIGKVLMQITLGFGCKVLVYDPFIKEPFNHPNIKVVDLDYLFANSDIISLHCPLTRDTEKIINNNSINKMKDGVYIINTSRGKLIDTKAAIAGLKSRKIGGLGIDVYEEEENLFFTDRSEDIIEDDTFERLSSFNNVLITAHQAFLTKEALDNICTTTLNNAKSLLNNQPALQENLVT